MNNYFVHDSAVVDEGCDIGKGTKIWHFSHIMTSSSIGENCIIGQNVLVGPNVTVGNKVKIQNNVSLYEGVIVEDSAFLGPSCVFTNVINPRSYIEKKDEFRQTKVGKGSSIGANSTILCGHQIGEYAIVGAGAVVVKDVHPFSIVAGNPAKQIGWACYCGETLSFNDEFAFCNVCGKEYVKEGLLIKYR